MPTSEPHSLCEYRYPRLCACVSRCMDVAEADDHPLATCKSLPMPPREPLVIIELVDRRGE